jgi:hypothetical protein
MIQDINNLAYNTGRWCVGYNNWEAIKDILSDRYYYNDPNPTPLTKAKQIGTEVLHGTLKCFSLVTLVDRTVYAVTNLDPQIAEQFPLRISIPNLSTIVHGTPYMLGIPSLLYTGSAFWNNGKEALKCLKKIIETDYNGNVSNISVPNLWGAIDNAASMVVPFHLVYRFGLNGATLTIPLTYVSNNYEWANTPAAKVIKGSACFYLAAQTPLVAPIVRTVATLVGTIADGFFSTVFGV